MKNHIIKMNRKIIKQILSGEAVSIELVGGKEQIIFMYEPEASCQPSQTECVKTCFAYEKIEIELGIARAILHHIRECLSEESINDESTR